MFQVDSFSLNPNEDTFNVARSLLLELWHHLLAQIDNVPYADLTNFTKVSRRLSFFYSITARKKKETSCFRYPTDCVHRRSWPS
jgi:hypothetical protein